MLTAIACSFLGCGAKKTIPLDFEFTEPDLMMSQVSLRTEVGGGDDRDKFPVDLYILAAGKDLSITIMKTAPEQRIATTALEVVELTLQAIMNEDSAAYAYQEAEKKDRDADGAPDKDAKNHYSQFSNKRSRWGSISSMPQVGINKKLYLYNFNAFSVVDENVLSKSDSENKIKFLLPTEEFQPNKYRFALDAYLSPHTESASWLLKFLSDASSVPKEKLQSMLNEGYSFFPIPSLLDETTTHNPVLLAFKIRPYGHL